MKIDCTCYDHGQKYWKNNVTEDASKTHGSILSSSPTELLLAVCVGVALGAGMLFYLLPVVVK